MIKSEIIVPLLNATGFIRIFSIEGAIVTVGERLAVIADTADEEILIPAKDMRSSLQSTSFRITKPARTGLASIYFIN